ncbi:hypothetical protein PHYBLDRAFT_153015 [Phycomyces blakesleeanus NRRL 1555(-)]|uniref:Uncharacterized protein n=1 Tax=Phycomyces blakesleeanus (strain ATCC 8743b / DSM 1359 / FGSC 10004 / NBRC 33097 / NRRL 1555) TaxID=763407 RepID=A0A162WAU3_PHYB8|nr:hypothetical protein PHYBLDRAFT_153015 [Phycomyces blakesleeanus NRRL 1555(-)]OAD65985.1 hypothetical protein PHYBLDRAFT_153015 [Phycomyces blakesleeanus NRRL 1555(-)]|eukprot:XP_018284025.1 hypothetical protein PHYBLDRAFT_153015 [Phycomyces blakesleeanus NRRL 1555(-)]
MLATSPCVWTQTMRTHACPDIRSYFELAKPKFICTKGYASMTDQLDSVEFADDFKHHAKPVTKQGELEIVTKNKRRLQLATGNEYTQENKTRVEGRLCTLSVVKEKQGYFL